MPTLTLTPRTPGSLYLTAPYPLSYLSIYNVKDYGAAGDGITDDTAAIQATIDAAYAAGGGTVLFPVATYVVNGTVSLTDYENIRLQGTAPAQTAPYFAVPTTGVIWKRVSGTGTMLDWSASVKTVSLRGCAIEDIYFNGNNLATTVVRLRSIWQGTFKNITMRDGTSVGLSLSTVAASGNLQGCVFENVAVSCGGSAKGLVADGAAGASGNVSLNTFSDLFVVTANGTGIELGYTDSNRFYGTVVNRTGSALGVDFLATSTGFCIANIFHHLDAVGGVTSRGLASGTVPADRNEVWFSPANGPNVLPTIEAGSVLTWHSTSGRTINVRPDYRQEAVISDDFIAGTATAFQIGSLGWNTGGGTTTVLTSGAVLGGHPGVMKLDTTAVSGTLEWIGSGSNGTPSILVTDLWDTTWVVQLNVNDSNTMMRLGMMGNMSLDPTDDGVFIEKLYADTSWFGVTRTAAAQTRTAALASVSTSWVTFRIRMITATKVGFTVNGGAEVTATANIPVVALMQPVLQIKNQNAASKTCHIDYFEQRISGLART